MEPQRLWRGRVWRGALVNLRRVRRGGWTDLLLVLGIAGVLFGLVDLLGEATAAHRPLAEIDLALAALPRYTFYSLSRGLAAYALSLAFTLAYGYWAAKDARAERVLIPLLDVLQSIPVLSFMPGILLAMVSLFPGSNVGLELAAVVSIFTGQVWNMVFSLYHSLRSIPLDRLEVAAVFRFSAWQKAKWVELPSAAIGLIWNSMMSMAGGWVFLTVIESFKLRDKDYRLPGLGSYLNEAWRQGEYGAMAAGFTAMVLMIVGLDRLLWRPVVVWAQKFRAEDDAAPPVTTSWVLTALRRSRLIRWLGGGVVRWLASRGRERPEVKKPTPVAHAPGSPSSTISTLALALLVALLVYGAWLLLQLLAKVSAAQWVDIFGAGALTLGRVTLATALGTLWVLPVGLAIGLSPRLAAWLQPVVQVIASIPAPIIYPLLVAGFLAAGVPLGWSSIVLMMMGTQWYILFNVISGAMALPADLREAARAYRLPLGLRLRWLYLPGVFPYLVTGWVTAAGGAWNLSIVSEYVTLREHVVQARGLGAMISDAFDHGAEAFPLLAASTLTLAATVVLINRTLWRSLYRIAEARYTLTK
jgi:NitT/TauT family transport system permease protein